MFKKVAVLALLLVLTLINWSILNKETHLREGKVVYLELVPVDPRSLMQGDYMALRFRVAGEVYAALPKKKDALRWRHRVEAPDGYVLVSLDARSVASFKRIYKEEPLAENELIIRYRVRNGAVKFATNAFFFQEGHGSDYQQARYGRFRVDDKGELLLTGMFDDKLNQLLYKEHEVSQ